MAVPCLANVERADVENWRRLERLLCELFLVLRDLLTTPSSAPGFAVSNLRRGPPPPPPSQGGGQGPSSAPANNPPSNNRTVPRDSSSTHGSHTCRRRNNSGGPSNKQASSSGPLSSTPACRPSSKQSWHQLGTELRDIADSLATSRRQSSTAASSTSRRSSTMKSISIVSSLVRVMLGGHGEPFLDFD